MPADVLQGGVEPVHDADGQHEVEVLLVPVGGRGRPRVRQAPHGLRAAAHLHAGLGEPRRHLRQEALGDGAVDQQRLQRVADARPLGLGVDDDRRRHVEIGAGVHEDVDEALVVLEDGHARALRHPPDEILAAARDDEVEQAVQLEHHRHRFAVGDVHELDGLRRRARLFEGLGQHGRDERIGLDGLAASAQQHGVAGLHAKAGRVRGHVRAGLVDEANDAERHANAGDLQPGGTAPGLDRFTDRIGQRGDLAQPRGHGLDAGVGERETIEERAGDAGGARALEVRAVGLEDGGRLLLEPARHLQQRVVLGAAAAQRQRPRGLPRRARLGLDESPDIARHRAFLCEEGERPPLPL